MDNQVMHVKRKLLKYFFLSDCIAGKRKERKKKQEKNKGKQKKEKQKKRKEKMGKDVKYVGHKYIIHTYMMREGAQKKEKKTAPQILYVDI